MWRVCVQWLAIPFVLLHPAVTSLSETARANDSWLGEAPQGPAIGLYIDSYLLLIFGGIPWQVNTALSHLCFRTPDETVLFIYLFGKFHKIVKLEISPI